MPALRLLRNFILKNISKPKSDLLSLVETNPAEATNYYHKTYLPLIKQQDRLDRKEFYDQLQKANVDDSNKSQTMTLVEIGFLVIILIAEHCRQPISIQSHQPTLSPSWSQGWIECAVGISRSGST